jgi:phage recombination protein Bet
MNTALVASAVDPDVSAAFQIFDRMRPLKDALNVTDLTDSELHVFAIVAHHTGLDPFSGQIRAVKRKGKVTHQTGIDGYRATAEKTRQYAGSDEATYEDCDCGMAPTGHPKVARVVVHRILANGHTVDQVGVARWHELYPEGDEGFMWRKMPFNQLAKCAEANGLRKAFPRVLGGTYIDEEMQQASETIEGTATEAPARPQTVKERVAARRAAIDTTEPLLADAAAATSPEPTATPSAPIIDMPDETQAAPTDRCGDGSPYGDGLTCGLLPAHKSPHRALDGSGRPVASWAETTGKTVTAV